MAALRSGIRRAERARGCGRRPPHRRTCCGPSPSRATGATWGREVAGGTRQGALSLLHGGGGRHQRISPNEDLRSSQRRQSVAPLEAAATKGHSCHRR